MKSRKLFTTFATLGVLSALVFLPGRQAHAQIVFQAAGPDAASILGVVDAFRAALGENNGPAAPPAPLPGGRREINWDGGGADTTTGPDNPMDTFLNGRGARFITPGIGLSQAPPSNGANGGLAVLFNNPTYGDIFKTFSPVRLFTPVGSRITEGQFFVPGTGGAVPAVVTGFGAVFTDVDKPRGESRNGAHSTVIDYFDADGRRIFTGFVPSAPGDGGLSFLGVLFDDPRVRSVRITTGDLRPGQDDDGLDIVMMDDFIYGEPQALAP
jgi:hypothetical protein